MKSQPRRIRSIITRTYILALMISFAVFTLMVAVFGFNLEDEIFELQVSEAANNFLKENPIPLKQQGILKAMDMTYYIGMDAMPKWLRAKVKPHYRDRVFEVFGEEHGHFHALVRTMPDGRNLYVFFNARRFIRSTPQIKTFLMTIGVMAGLGLAVSLVVLARMSRKVSVPLEDMAEILDDGKSVQGRFDIPEKAPKELHALAQAIEERDTRIQALLERERQFNRDASHELRTPLAVAFGATEVLEEKGGNNPGAMTRLKAAIKDMQQLTEGILWLGRDPDNSQKCDIAKVCVDSIRAYRHLTGDRDVEVYFTGAEGIEIPAPEPVAQVMVGNILRNSLSYTDKGEVVLRAFESRLEILDTGTGFGGVSPEREGFGIGLTLVKRLCTHFDISFDVAARVDGGTIATLSWTVAV